MVHCIVVGCGNKSGKHKTNFSKIPKIVVNQGEEWEELTRERRNRWISAVSRGDTEVKNVLGGSITNTHCILKTTLNLQ